MRSRVMILAPHQDDELILCGSFLKELQKKHNVYIVFLTNGDYQKQVRYVRMKEAIEVAGLYGIDEDKVIFLGYANEYEEGAPHIYNAAAGEIVRSQYGNAYTYGLEKHREYCYNKIGVHHAYTRDNILQDLYNVVKDIMPDVIFATDMEVHPDHCANSLLLDEVLGRLLREYPGFQPLVLKKPGYNTAWFGKKDYTVWNNKQAAYDFGFVVNYRMCQFADPYLRWRDRVRLPVGASNRKIKKQENILYKGLELYTSQNAIEHFDNMMNSDVVFWGRRTDSLTYRARMVVSSGNGECLRDFKPVDSKDVRRKGRDYWNIEKTGWVPDEKDKEPVITFYFPEPKCIEEIVIYQQFYAKSRIDLCDIEFSNGEKLEVTQIEIRKKTTIKVHAIQTDFVRIRIKKCSGGDGRPQINQIEIFEKKQHKPLFLKALIHDNFVYEYVDDKTPWRLQGYQLLDTLESRKLNFSAMKIRIIERDGTIVSEKKYFDEFGNFNGKIKDAILVEMCDVSNPTISDRILLFENKQSFYRFKRCEEKMLQSGNSYETLVKKYFSGKEKMPVIYFIGTPNHHNVGDHLIAYATEQFLREVFPMHNIVEISMTDFDERIKDLKKTVTSKDCIVLQGGGNMGNVYWNNERIRREVLKTFPNNHIVIFPETIFYESNQEGKDEERRSVAIYNRAKNLTICAREEASYEKMCALYGNCKVICVPDIVFWLKLDKREREKNGCVIVARSDGECCIDREKKESIEKILEQNHLTYRYGDMMRKRGYLGKGNRAVVVREKIRMIESAEIVITDRLHAMILSYLTRTPCIVIGGYNHKIKSTYTTWLEQVPYIRFMDAFNETALQEYLCEMREMTIPEPVKISRMQERLIKFSEDLKEQWR